MREITVCGKCGSGNIDYLGGGKYYCNNCQSEQDSMDKYVESSYERTKRQVYATGNKWAIENFNATH
jgi:NADH pyrophosphatase NudC (nudix superfamily)